MHVLDFLCRRNLLNAVVSNCCLLDIYSWILLYGQILQVVCAQVVALQITKDPSVLFKARYFDFVLEMSSLYNGLLVVRAAQSGKCLDLLASFYGRELCEQDAV